LIFVDPWLTSWGSLEMQTQVSPWLSLSSSGMVESCSSLFVSDTPAILMVKEGTSLEFAWKLHLQWLRRCHVWPWLSLVLIANGWADLFEDDRSKRILANMRWVAICFSSAS
jgi:hypothetical protein